MEKRKSLWERITGSVGAKEEENVALRRGASDEKGTRDKKPDNNWMEEENEEAELAVDVYKTPTEIIVQTMVAGVKPEDLEISIGRDMLTIVGKREEYRTIDEGNYFTKELYWGKFSRTISLPQEIEPEKVEATEKHGLLTIKMQKVDKDRTTSVKIKSL